MSFHISNIHSSMRQLLSTSALLLLLVLVACTPKTGSKTASTPTPPAEPAEWQKMGKPDPNEEKPQEITLMEAPVIKPEPMADTLPKYNPSHTFEHDLLHTKIEISFDWAKKRANGKATLTLRPWFYETDKLTLDAKNFDIKSVNFEGKTDQLKYNYNGEVLVIELGRKYKHTEEYKIAIAYTAKPDERNSYGGSAAITSDKGLYFINADGSDPEKPRQIWTQGETESNSFWFPTVDKPNERCTQEMYITVEDKYKTLSNGVLVSGKKNADGTRTDYWKMDKPHTPYLFMMAIGEYAVVKDKWRNIDVDYYVEPKYEQYARDIFPFTTEMLEMFSKKLNYEYPWQKYAQVVVRDYVSGAMENTTSVIFGDYVQKNRRELMDDHLTNEKVVAHEMFHHWFGDLVTTESWANLTLNEGFANYAEYLWMEHKYGRDAADHHLMQEHQGYLFSAQEGGHPLIYFGHQNREDMFDAHSYNKGGSVLHMLRNYVGDAAFFAALNRYLKRNEYTDVEVHELRLAFEDVTGQDLNWFFNQWYLGAGHPMLNISYDWNETKKQASVTIKQTQEGSKEIANVFVLPLTVDIYDVAGKVRRENIKVDHREQTFTFDCAAKPAMLNVDADRMLLSISEDEHTEEEWIFMYRNAPRFADRWAALENLEKINSAEAMAVYVAALNDPFWGIREKALSKADPRNPLALAAVEKMAASDPEPGVRAAALGLLAENADKKHLPLFQKGINSDQPYSVLGAALNGLTKLDLAAALEASKALENEDSDAVIATLAELYAQTPNRAQLGWFKKNAAKVDQMSALNFFDFYQQYIIQLKDAALLDETIGFFKGEATNLTKNSQWRRFASTKAIADVRNHLREQGDKTKVEGLDKMIADIKAAETDSTLKLYYDMF
jgi:aminopeptidase N